MKSLLLFLIQILWLRLIGHVILSWRMAAGVRNDVVVRAYAAIGQILDPFMRPLRRVVPQVGMLDLTPLVALIILFILQTLINRLL